MLCPPALPLREAAALTCFLPALHSPQWQLSSHFQRAGPQSLAVKRAAPVYAGGSLGGAACLVDCELFFFLNFFLWLCLNEQIPSLQQLPFLIG